MLPLLTSINCRKNSLVHLDVRNGNNSLLTAFTADGNSDLKCILVDDPWYAAVNFPDKPYLSYGIKDDLAQYTSVACGNNIISGKVYHDADTNCIKDGTEQGVPNVIVKVDGPNDFYSNSNDTGYYEIFVDSNTNYQISVIADTVETLIKGYCPVAGIAVNSGSHKAVSGDVNFGMDLNLCAVLSTQIATCMLRRCYKNKVGVLYENVGSITQFNVNVYVDFPEYIKFISSNYDYTLVDEEEDIYQFNIDSVEAFSRGVIYIVDSVICGMEEIRGRMQCIKSWITPPSHCIEPLDTTGWDNSNVKVKENANCLGDSLVGFTLKNNGLGDMTSSKEYRLYYDDALAYKGTYQLMAQDSLLIYSTADGSTVRFETDEIDRFSGDYLPAINIEGCGSSNPSDTSVGVWANPLENGLDIDVSEMCIYISDSYDPNDKQVSPAGITEYNYVPEKGPLTYTIRFQNTGTAEAYNVYLVDTLSDQLDLSTFKIRGASHEYTYKIEGTDQIVLTFTFANINLPDSTTNEVESHGFIIYTISPIKGITPGTVIENYADIFFDYNSPIRTNVTSVTAIDTVIISNAVIKVTESGVPIGIAESKILDINIYPNPTKDYIFIEGNDQEFNELQIYDVNGRLLISQLIGEGRSQIDVSKLVAGVYIIHVANDKDQSYSFKMVKE
ncbi:MAG: T9SS type A sorting domain-containing protein [Flavobacteriales bacterium]|nr:T9SS type A sorting domain-containing protein [Flavobacteriales bacterium]